MKSVLAVLLLALLPNPQPLSAAGGPVVVEKTFWVKPGKERQFAALVQRTELQRLLKEKQAGRIQWIRITEPALVGATNDWDLRLTVAWASYDDMLNDAAAVPERQSQASIEDVLRRDLVENQSEVLVKESSAQAGP